MNICNFEIHNNCGFYSSSDDVAIKKIDRSSASDVLFVEEKLTYSKLLFVIEGVVKIKINKLDVQVISAGSIGLVPCNSYFIGSIEPGTLVLSVAFSEKEPFCSCYSLVNLMHDTYSHEDDFEQRQSQALPIHHRLKSFVQSALDAVDDGIPCSGYFATKRQELFFLLINYYSREDLAQFFHPLFCFNRKFEEMVMTNYDSVTDVKHFAALAHMPVTTFQRKFKKHFKTSVKQWLLDRKAERMLSDIKNTNRSITDLSQRYGFSSVSYFSNFCKHYFGKTPTELRAEGNTD